MLSNAVLSPEPPAVSCYISLGANLGNRQAALEAALRVLSAVPGIRIAAVSSFYETEPWGKTDQPSFINAVAELQTTLSPEQLLAVCQQIEQQLGRIRHEHWGARTIDLDLLFIPGIVRQTPTLTLPHPYMLERAFVLVPLAEIAGNLVFKERTIAAHCQLAAGRGGVRRLTANNEKSNQFSDF